MQAQVEQLSVPVQTHYERRYGVYMASRATSFASSPPSHSNTPSTLSGIVSHGTSVSEVSADEDIIIFDSTGIVTGPIPSLRPISIGIYRQHKGAVRKIELPPIVTDLKGYKKGVLPKLTVAGSTERGRTKDREQAAGAGGLLKVPEDPRHGRSGTRPRVLAMQKPRLSLEAPATFPQKSMPPHQSQPILSRDIHAGEDTIDHDRPDLLCPPPAPKPPSLLLRIPVPVASSPTPKLSTQLQLTPIAQALPNLVVSDASSEKVNKSPQPYLRLVSLQLRSKVYHTNMTRSDEIVSKPVLSQLVTTDLANYRHNAQAAAAQQALAQSSRKKENDSNTSRPGLFNRKAVHRSPARALDNEHESRSRVSSGSSAGSHSHNRRPEPQEGSPIRPTWLKRKARGVVSMVSGCIKDPEGRQGRNREGASTTTAIPVVPVAAPSDSESGSDSENVEGRNSATRRRRNRDIIKERVRKLFGHHVAGIEFDSPGLEEHWVYVERCLEQPNTSAVDMLAATGLPFGASPPRSARIQEAPAIINIAPSNSSTDSGPETTFPVTGWSPSIERRSHSIQIVDPEVSPLDGDVAESEWHLVLDQNILIKEVDIGCYRDWAGYGAEKQCGICLEDYQPDDAVLRLASCSHWLHQDCLQQWFKSSRTCPVCRQEIGLQAKSESLQPASSIRPIFSVSPSVYGSSLS
ncbi:hypothetical protein CVT24_005408 [Panaeolus cyanescens]|uniref:RING-type domain-containing protein n=1 Tax=Panaeolus cyanescens TaxID=181874 RepID=A0A409Y932_9AGAR|nr:hypothetical protein CVT24_005408 [Panaeolus cyanescens]